MPYATVITGLLQELFDGTNGDGLGLMSSWPSRLPRPTFCSVQV